MKTLIILLFSHFLLDWSLQDDMTKKNKSKYLLVLIVHCIIWSFGISIVLMYLNLFTTWKLIMLLVGHLLMDYWKCHRLYERWPLITYRSKSMPDHYTKLPLISDIMSLYIDQIFHVIQILLCLI